MQNPTADTSVVWAADLHPSVQFLIRLKTQNPKSCTLNPEPKTPNAAFLPPPADTSGGFHAPLSPVPQQLNILAWVAGSSLKSGQF